MEKTERKDIRATFQQLGGEGIEGKQQSFDIMVWTPGWEQGHVPRTCRWEPCGNPREPFLQFLLISLPATHLPLAARQGSVPSSLLLVLDECALPSPGFLVQWLEKGYQGGAYVLSTPCFSLPPPILAQPSGDARRPSALSPLQYTLGMPSSLQAALPYNPDCKLSMQPK